MVKGSVFEFRAIHKNLKNLTFFLLLEIDENDQIGW